MHMHHTHAHCLVCTTCHLSHEGTPRVKIKTASEIRGRWTAVCGHGSNVPASTVRISEGTHTIYYSSYRSFHMYVKTRRHTHRKTASRAREKVNTKTPREMHLPLATTIALRSAHEKISRNRIPWQQRAERRERENKG